MIRRSFLIALILFAVFIRVDVRDDSVLVSLVNPLNGDTIKGVGWIW